MRKIWIIALLLLLAVPLSAQEEAAEEDVPEIDYYRSPVGFNVPVLGDGWVEQGDGETALFVNETLSAQIQVTAVRTLDDEEAIQTALDNFLADSSVEPVYSDRIGLTNGTWTQNIYQDGDSTISALALVRSDRTFVVSFVETSADYDAYQLTVRNSDPESLDPQEGVANALERLLSIDPDEPESITALNLPSGEWQEYDYSADLTAYGFVFRGITYSTIITGDAPDGAELADAYDTVFLGFFMTPNNDEFLYLGLASSAFIFLVLIGSIWWRFRNARQDLQLIEQLENE